MSINSLLILAISFSGAILPTVIANGNSILKITEKITVLHTIYAEKWNEIFSNLPGEEPPSITPAEIGHLNEGQLIAALHELYQSAQLNLMCWHCSYFRKTCPNHTDDYKSARCAEVGKFMAWYNERMSAKAFLNAFKQSQGEGSNTGSFKYNINEVADRVDNMLNYLKIVNRVFIEANLNYDNIFQKLKAAGVTLTDEETTSLSKSAEIKAMYFIKKGKSADEKRPRRSSGNFIDLHF